MRAAGQGMVLRLSALNGVCNFLRVCPQQSKVARLSSLNMAFPKPGPKVGVISYSGLFVP